MSTPWKRYQGRAAETGGDLGCEGRGRDWIEVAGKKQSGHIALHRLEDVARQQLDVPIFACGDLRLCIFQLRSHQTRVETRRPDGAWIGIPSFSAYHRRIHPDCMVVVIQL